MEEVNDFAHFSLQPPPRSEMLLRTKKVFSSVQHRGGERKSDDLKRVEDPNK